MRRTLAATGAALAALSLATPISAGEAPLEVHLEKYHRPGARVIIVVQNVSDERQRLAPQWTITRTKSGEVLARLHWGTEERWLAPDQTAIWEWDQREGTYTNEPAPPDEGEKVGPGGYEVTLDESDASLTRRFQVGRFFTLGFEGRDATFTVFANEAGPIRRMKAEAAAEEKRLIVSGTVRGERRYNGTWSYSMGPGSIVVAEAFVEVCDASPGYVERHRDEWLGERWCPWSSYVAEVGR